MLLFSLKSEPGSSGAMPRVLAVIWNENSFQQTFLNAESADKISEFLLLNGSQQVTLHYVHLADAFIQSDLQ